MRTTIALLAAAACATGTFATTSVHAEEGSWMVRVRAINIGPADQSTAFTALETNFAKDAVDVSSKVAPDISFEYFIGGPLSVELLLTIPQEHDVKLARPTGAALNLGSFKHLPPTLLLKYNFMPEGTFRPYVGAGVNYTRISDVQLAVPGEVATPLDLDKSSFGLAGQIGLDVKLTDNLFGNVDVKWIDIDADVKLRATGARLTTVSVDPWVIGVGIGYRF